MGLNTNYIMGIFGEFTKKGKTEYELQIFDWLTETAKSNEAIQGGLNQLEIFDYINQFIQEMADEYWLKTDKYFNEKGFQFHQAKELAWQDVTELIQEKIHAYEPTPDYPYDYEG